MPESIGRAPEQFGLPRVQLQPIRPTSHPAGDVVETLRNVQQKSVNVSRRAPAVNLSVVGIGLLVRRKVMLRNNCSLRKVSDIQYE